MRFQFLLSTFLGHVLLSNGPVAKCNEPANVQAVKAQASDVHDVVLLAPNRPILMRLHVKVDGKPVQQAWDDFFGHLFGLLDTDKDGKLDAEERAQAPAPNTLFNTANPYAYNVLIDGRVVATSTAANLKNAKEPFGLAELGDYYRSSGVTPLRIVGGSTQPIFNGLVNYNVPNGGGAGPSAEKVTKAFITMLDRNSDGRLSVAELRGAEASLLKRDFDEDEILTIQESIGNLSPATPNYRFAINSYYRPVAMAQGHLVFPIASKKPSAGLARVLLKTYAARKEPGATELTRLDLGLSKEIFERLDADKNGKLDNKELARFADRMPDVEMSFDVGAKPAVSDVKNRPGGGFGPGLPSPQGIMIQKQQQVDLDFVQMRFSVGAAGQNLNVSYVYTTQYQKQIFQSIDRDKNGYVDEKEARLNASYRNSFKLIDSDGDGKLYLKEIEAHFQKWQSLQSRAQLATVSLSLFEEGNGFFGLLDANGDSRLSVREMRGACALLAKLDRDKDGGLDRGEIPLRYHVSLSKGSSQNAAYWLTQEGSFLVANPRLAPSAVANLKAPLWFLKMDRNHDGDVSEREFLGKKEIFKKLDKDGDRLVSVREAEQFDALQRRDRK